MATNRIFSLVMFLVLLMATPQYVFAQQKKKCKEYPRLMSSAKAFIEKEDYRQALEKLNAAKACDPLQAAVCNELILSVFDKIDAQRKSAEAARLAATKAKKQANIAEKKATVQSVIALEEKKMAQMQKQIADEQRLMALQQKRISDSFRVEAERQTTLANVQSLLASEESKKAQASALATKALQILNQNNTLALRLVEEADKIASTEDTKEALSDITKNNKNLYYNLVLEGHLGAVNCMAVNPVNHFILTGSADYSAKLWDNQGTFVRTLYGHKGSVNAVAVSPKGDFLLTGGADDKTIVWRSEGVAVDTIVGDTIVTSLAFSEDNKTFIIGYANGSAKMRYLNSKEQVAFKHPFNAQIDTLRNSFSITAVAFLGDTILTASGDSTVQLWNKKGKQIAQLKHPNGVTAMAVLGNSILTGCADGQVRLWEMRQNMIVEKGKNAQIGETAFEITQTFIGHKDAVTSVALGFYGTRNDLAIISGSADNSSILWTKAGKIDNILQGHSKSVNAVGLSKDCILTGSADGTVKIWQITGNQSIVLEENKGIIKTIALSPDGNTVAIGGEGKKARFISLSDTTASLSGVFPGGSKDIYASAFSPQGDKILFGDAANTAILFDIKTKKTLKTFQGHTNAVNAVAFSPDGKTALTGSSDKTAKLWDMQGRVLDTFVGHLGSIYGVVFAPDGKTVVTASADFTLKLWDIETHQNIRTFSGHTGQVYAVAFSPDGKQLVSGSEDKTLRLWDIASDTPIRSLVGHNARINAVAFSPDGQLIISGSTDKTVRVWSKTELLLPILEGHKASVNALSFSKDGQYILSGSSDATLLRWLWTPISKLTTLQKIEYKRPTTDQEIMATNHSDLLELYAQTLVKQWDKKTDLDTTRMTLIHQIFDTLTSPNRFKMMDGNGIELFAFRFGQLQKSLRNKAVRDAFDAYKTRLPTSKPVKMAAMRIIIDPFELKTKNRIISVGNVFETGSAQGEYDDISIYNDGHDAQGNPMRQITYGRIGTTEQGDLLTIVNSYIDNNGFFADDLRPYLSQIGVVPLVDDRAFIDILKKSGQEDTIMQVVQDQYFEKRYFQPALKFFTDNGFTTPLSMAVIYDSYLHSGSIRNDLRTKFTTLVPAKGGDEKEWIKNYTQARREWLISRGGVLAKTAYRPDFFLKEIEKDNWQLVPPLLVNGVNIKK